MPRWTIWYDDQCEVCQAGLAWLRRLDRNRCVRTVPISQCLAAEDTNTNCESENVGIETSVQGGRRPSSGPIPSQVTINDLLRHLYAQDQDGSLFVGAAAVAAIAQTLPRVSWVGWLAQLPGLRTAAAWLYDWIARHRYSMSRCRGGACRSVRVDMVRQKASWRAFNLCRLVGWMLVSPLSVWLYVQRLSSNVIVWNRTYRRTITVLGGRMDIHYLGGGLSDTVPLLFGELFSMIRYRSLLVDPGGTRMRHVVAHHLRRRRLHRRTSNAALSARKITATSVAKSSNPSHADEIQHIAPTHAHEEHCGNLDLATRLTGARLHAHPRAISLLKSPARLPWIRDWVIGQPVAVTRSIEPLGNVFWLGDKPEDEIWVLETPGHCDEHVAFYAPGDKLLLIGDAFMGTHFSSPNEDVNHHAWIDSLQRILELDIEIMVESHGHIHTQREDVLAEMHRQGVGMLASRQDPLMLLREKQNFLRWVAQQIAIGERDGLPANAIRATMFPWTQKWSYASVLQDTLAVLLSSGGFGRHRMVRSFQPPMLESQNNLPTVYEVCWRLPDSNQKVSPA